MPAVEFSHMWNFLRERGYHFEGDRIAELFDMADAPPNSGLINEWIDPIADELVRLLGRDGMLQHQTRKSQGNELFLFHLLSNDSWLTVALASIQLHHTKVLTLVLRSPQGQISVFLGRSSIQDFDQRSKELKATYCDADLPPVRNMWEAHRRAVQFNPSVLAHSSMESWLGLAALRLSSRFPRLQARHRVLLDHCDGFGVEAILTSSSSRALTRPELLPRGWVLVINPDAENVQRMQDALRCIWHRPLPADAFLPSSANNPTGNPVSVDEIGNRPHSFFATELGLVEFWSGYGRQLFNFYEQRAVDPVDRLSTIKYSGSFTDVPPYDGPDHLHFTISERLSEVSLG